MADPLLQRIRHAATHNKRLKLASVALALVSWVVIHSIISHERLVRDVPVSMRTDEGWAVLDAEVKTVNILFRGSQEDLRALELAPVRVEVDARKKAGGLQEVRLLAENVQVAGAARAMYMDPATVMFVLDQQGEKSVTVKADFQGNAVEEAEVTQIRCEPAVVMLHGPRRRLAEIDAVHTTPIDLEGRSRSFRKTHVALVLKPNTWLANGTASNITVDVTMAERAATRTFQDVPVNAMLPSGAPGAIRLQPAQVNLT
ncbi:MAG: YbbR-like domain-containing protein, partial [Kiritimatiellaeota bacterium]|nr:YbbR-like domain-containing protein [Kiritimatiellota bacterium]